MSWQSYWQNYFNKEQSILEQVQRTVRGKALSEEDITNTSKFIINHIDETGTLLDLCCGNGLLTSKFKAKNIVGIDFSESHIKVAQNNFPNIQFICEDVQNIDHLFEEQFDTITLNFSFQYFSYTAGKELINKMSKLLAKNGKIYLSDIPEKKKQHLFAGIGFQKIKYYIKYYIGIEKTGKFWSEKELQRICNSFDLKGKYIIQPSHLPYSKYRFDYLITNN